MNTHFRHTTIATLLAALAACDRAPVEQPPAAQSESAQTARASRTACERVSAQQMSLILGTAMNAAPKSNTECDYTPKNGDGLPLAQLTVDLGSAEAAMTATGMLGQMEPGMTNPYAGLGDQAAAIGPAVWIRRGEDLLIITVMGVDDHDAAVRRVYQLIDENF